MDTLQTNTTIVSACLCVNDKNLWRWYRDYLSGFFSEATQQKHYQHDVVTETVRGKKTIRVPILVEANFGKNMAIDEKQIGEDMHTVISNRDTGKIAMLARTVNAQELKMAISGIGDKTDNVEQITRDMSHTFAKFCNENFSNASHIADKFHVVCSVTEANQDVRVRYRQEALRERRLKHEQFKQQEKERKQQFLEQEKEYTKKQFKYHEETLSNGETILEALARSRYSLYKYRSQWTNIQEERALSIFEKYPEIEQAYNLACDFRVWIKSSNVGKDMVLVKNELRDWFKAVDQSAIDEMLNFKSMIERNMLEVLNYFRFGATNAIAENINGRIQRFVRINQGTRDREFFYFRLANYFC